MCETGIVKTLGSCPGTPFGLSFSLQVATRQIHANGPAPNALGSLLDREIFAGLADGNHKFNFVLEIFSTLRKRHLGGFA
mgnify:CR=1 FL=1